MRVYRALIFGFVRVGENRIGPAGLSVPVGKCLVGPLHIEVASKDLDGRGVL